MKTEVCHSTEFKNIIQKVNRRASSYLIFHVPDVKTAEFKIISEGKPVFSDYNSTETPSITKIISKFDECKRKALTYDSCFVLYDFYFINDNKAIRNILILMCYINDEKCPLVKKFFYSSNAMRITEEVNAAKYISIHSQSDFTYDKIKDICKSHKKN